MTIDRINELIARRTLTAQEREEVRDAADKAGIQYTVKRGCRTCYETILLKLYEAQVRDLNTSVDGYRLKRASISFKIGGTIYNNESIKDFSVGYLHPVIVSTYFVKVESDGTDGEV